MSKIDFGRNCPLAQNLEETSTLESAGRKAHMAGALLFGLGYPRFDLRLPDIIFTAHLLRHIKDLGHSDLISEAIETCMHCPQSANCEVGSLVLNRVKPD